MIGALNLSTSSCKQCQDPFILQEEVKKNLLVTTCCYKIFHITCFKEWFKKEKSCSYCRQPIDPNKAAKPISALWKVFQLALIHKVETIDALFKTHNTAQGSSSALINAVPHDSECPICFEDYPDTHLCYVQQKGAMHVTCALSQDAEKIGFPHIVAITKALLESEPSLAAAFK